MEVREDRSVEQLQQLARALEAMERRVAALEGMLAVSAAVPPPPAGLAAAVVPAVALPVSDLAPDPAPDLAPDLAPDFAAEAGAAPASAAFELSLALIGRTLVVLGGAYLLRALTDAGVLAGPLGVAVGFLYAAGWLLTASRASTGPSAVFHTLAATLIAIPLVWEATFRFHLLGPVSGAAVLALFAIAAIAVAILTRLEVVAWIGAGSTALLVVPLAVATEGFVAYTVFLILLGLGTLWLGYLYDWLYLRWPIAGLAALLVAAVSARAGAGHEPLAAVLVQTLYLAGYLGSFAARTLFLGRAVVPFEVAQSIVALIAGFGGAVYVTSTSGANVAGLGLLALALGLSTYAVAFAFVERHRPARNFFFYASLALVFLLVGGPLAMRWDAAAVAFSALAIVCLIVSRRVSRLTLSLHCVVYAVAGAVLSGLLTGATLALLLWGGEAATGVSIPSLLALAAILACALWPARAGTPVAYATRAPEFVLLGLGVWLAAGTAVGLLVPLLPVVDAGRIDQGALAATRTLVLVGATLLLAWARRSRRLLDVTWMVNPLLAMVAVKLLVEDLPQGRPLTLMIALGAYGAALIIAPRLK
jgi:hypothetical protein